MLEAQLERRVDEMEISLIRHGRSTLNDNEKITGSEFKQWVEKYDRNSVYGESEYPFEAIEKMQTSNIVITSDLIRAVESAKLLNPDVDVISYSLFRETELPTYTSKLLNVKLRPSIWAIIMRILWFGGYSNNCESLKEAKLRAEKATQQLIDYAKEHKSVVLVGHGFFNRFIAKELQKEGWKGNRRNSSRHWSCTTLKCDINN